VDPVVRLIISMNCDRFGLDEIQEDCANALRAKYRGQTGCLTFTLGGRSGQLMDVFWSTSLKGVGLAVNDVASRYVLVSHKRSGPPARCSHGYEKAVRVVNVAALVHGSQAAYWRRSFVTSIGPARSTLSTSLWSGRSRYWCSNSATSLPGLGA